MFTIEQTPTCPDCDHASHERVCEAKLSSNEACPCDQGNNPPYNCDRCGVDFPTVKGYYDHGCPFDF